MKPSWVVDAQTIDLHGRRAPIWVTEADGLLWYAIHHRWHICTSSLTLGDVLYQGHILEKVSSVKQLTPNTKLVIFGTKHNGVNLSKLESHVSPLTHHVLKFPNGGVMMPITYEIGFKLMSVEDFYHGVTRVLAAR
jgi:hypothetical protein